MHHSSSTYYKAIIMHPKPFGDAVITVASIAGPEIPGTEFKRRKGR